MPHRSKVASLSRWAPPLTTLLAVAGCAAIGSAWTYITTERPPYPLHAVELASDLRLDSTNAILGSFIGTGTNGGIALLSSDTGFIAELLRRGRPDLLQGRDPWSALARYGPIRLDPTRLRNAPRTPPQRLRLASPYGHSVASVEEIVLRGSSCGWRGAKAEIYVSGPQAGSRAPSIRGPIIGSMGDATSDRNDWRDPPPRPGSALEQELIARSERDMDSLLALRLPRPLGPLAQPARQHLILDPLEEIDAAEVVPLWAGQGRVRYAVAIRATRLTPAGDPLLASTVMIWDSAGLWRQSVLAPTVVSLRRGQLRPVDGGGSLPLYWDHLDAVSGFGLDRDYLFLEQVDVDQGSVYWGAIEGRTNNVVAAAEVGGVCSDGTDDRRGPNGRDRDH